MIDGGISPQPRRRLLCRPPVTWKPMSDDIVNTQIHHQASPFNHYLCVSAWQRSEHAFIIALLLKRLRLTLIGKHGTVIIGVWDVTVSIKSAGMQPYRQGSMLLQQAVAACTDRATQRLQASWQNQYSSSMAIATCKTIWLSTTLKDNNQTICGSLRSKRKSIAWVNTHQWPIISWVGTCTTDAPSALVLDR